MVVASGEYSVVLWWFGKMARNTTVGGILGLRMFSKIFQIILSHSFKVTGQSVFVVQSQSQCAKGRFQKTWTIPSSHSSKIRTGYYKLSTLNPFLTNQTKHVRANFNRVGTFPLFQQTLNIYYFKNFPVSLFRMNGKNGDKGRKQNTNISMS